MGYYCSSRRYWRRSHSVPSVGLVILAVIGVNLLMHGSHIGGGILLAIAATRFLRWASVPRMPRAGDGFGEYRGGSDAIKHDAMTHGAVIPDDDPTWRGLVALYQKYERTRAAYPALAGQYAELLATMWERLRPEADLHQWRSIPRRLLEEWPMPWAGAGNDDPLNQSLANAKRAARQWRDAHREAHSNSPL